MFNHNTTCKQRLRRFEINLKIYFPIHVSERKIRYDAIDEASTFENTRYKILSLIICKLSKFFLEVLSCFSQRAMFLAQVKSSVTPSCKV